MAPRSSRGDTGATRAAAGVVVGVLLSATVIAGQAVITAPKNKYTPARDVELGHDAASRRESVLRPWCRSPGRIRAERRRLSEGHRVDPDYPLSCRSKS
jgi:hypothetical protein